MYSVSPAFHNAVAAGNDQKALLVFDDCIFTDEDIVIDNGIEFNDRFNVETDLCIGQALSNEVSFSLVNKNRLLNNYGFGDFLATIGVYIDNSTYVKAMNETVRVEQGNNSIVGYNSYPYVMRNGAPIGNAPNFGVISMIAFNDRVYCFGDGNGYRTYRISTGEDLTASYPASAFLIDKGHRLEGYGMSYENGKRTLRMNRNGTSMIYEFCPLGWFTADRPNAPDVIQIDMTCYDYMLKFEKDMSWFNISYPITIRGLYEAIGQKVLGEGNYIVPSDFINGGALIDKEPLEFDSATGRDVLKWIAEASATNARINRDGKLELAWIGDTFGTTMNESRYSEFNPYWYEVPQITKLVNRSTQEGVDYTAGEGDCIYLIQDNPLLKGVANV